MNSLDGLSGRIEMTEKKISELEDGPIEIVHYFIQHDLTLLYTIQES